MANTRPQIAVPELTIVSRTKNSISIRWTKATDKETPQSKLQYTVTWCVAPYKWDNNVRHIGEKRLDNSSYVITGLTPNTTYDIIVYVRDEYGAEGTYSITTVTTLPDTDVDNLNPGPNPTYSLQFYLCGTVVKDGNRYTILPDIVRPYDNNGSFLVLDDEFGFYLHKTDGKNREGFFIDSKYISFMISDRTGLSARLGSMHVRNTDGKIANSSAVLIKMLKNGSFQIRVWVHDPNNSNLVLLDKTLTVEVKNPAWPAGEKASTLKATSATGYSLGFKWEKMNDKNVRYNAYLKESKDKEWKKIADRCTDMSGIGCGGLKADTQYDFYYEIVDEKGKVLRHEECTARTSDKVLKVSNVTSGGFTIGWEPLADKNVTDYGVYLAGEGPGTAWCKKMKGIKSYTYTGLKPGIRYTTLVYAYGPDGKEVFTYEASDAVCIPFPADAKNIVLKPGITSCNGVYGEGAVGLDVNLGSQFNRKYFEVSFDYYISATDKDSVRNDNIITFDSSYRALGLIMKEGSIFVTTNNGSKYFDAGIRYKKGKWEHINLILIDGDLVINSKLIKVGDIKWSTSNNILSSRNFSNGHAFMGQFRNLIVKTKPSSVL